MIVDNWSIPGLIYTQYLGTVTGSDLVEHALQKSGDERFDNIQYIIADWSHIAETNLNPTDIQRLIACLKSISKICPNAKNGSVVNRRESGLSMAAWYCLLGEELPWQIDIFDSVGEAFDTYKLDLSQLKDSDHFG